MKNFQGDFANLVLEKLKAELGNLVYQLAVKEALLEQLRKDNATNTASAADSEDK